MGHDIKVKVGSQIRKLRKERGISQEEAAFNAHISASHLGQIERGEKNVTIETLERIAFALQKPLYTLVRFGGNEGDSGDKKPAVRLLFSLEEGFGKLTSWQQSKLIRIFSQLIQVILERNKNAQ